MNMKRGFVTIATGDDRYYRMARNLLRSYRLNCKDLMPFAIIADRDNDYTREFDDVVIIDKPTNSWMDKLRLLDSCPYDENLFLDADCLVYRDINFLWELFQNSDDFSCFGKALPLDDKGGWFTNQASQFYPIHFCTHLHGMLYFIRKTETLDRMHELCLDIISNYKKIEFKGFNEIMADEPVYALAMAVLDLRPVDRRPDYYCFVPYALKFSSNFERRTVRFTYPAEDTVDECFIVHWGNRNTLRAQYRFAASVLDCDRRSGMLYTIIYRTGLLLLAYRVKDWITDLCNKIAWFFSRIAYRLKKYAHKNV